MLVNVYICLYFADGADFDVVLFCILASIAAIHPLDVIRTRIQTDKSKQGGAQILRSILNTNGIRGLYTGFTPPLVGQAVYKAVIFSTNNLSRRIILSQKPDGNKRLTMAENSLCGAIAGAVNSLVVCPVELVRNRLIVSAVNKSNIYTGPLDCLRKVIRNDGVTGLYRGWIPTVLRDGPGLAAWFVGFEAAKKTLPKFTSLKENDSLTLLISGSCGGIAFWTVALPMDAIKSIIQTSYGNENNSRVFIKKIIDNGVIKVIRDLYRGYPVAIARGIPASAIVFLVNQRASAFLHGLF